MTTRVVNRERLAWDTARVVVRALGSATVSGWLHGQLATRLGPEPAAALAASRERLWASPRLDAAQVEAGIWRAKVLELLVADGALVEPLRQLTAETLDRLMVATDIREPGAAAVPAGPRLIDLDRFRR